LRPSHRNQENKYQKTARYKIIDQMTVFIESDRLILRQFTDTEEDGALLFELDSDPAVMRYIGPFAQGSIEAYRERMRNNWLPYYTSHSARGFWAVIEKSTNQFVGWFLLRPAPDYLFATHAGWTRPTDIELGYRLRQSAWGRGIATEVARELARITLADPAVTSVVSCALVGNRASTRVMEKVGMSRVREFMLPGFTEPSVMYALCREGSPEG
jgi:[ribosomal protein S5]-alanine N-acetyltransferase